MIATTAQSLTQKQAAPEMSSYEKVVAQNLDALLRIARRLTWPNQDTAADLVQDAVLKGLLALRENKLSLTLQTGAWLKQAVYLEFLMHRRDNQRLQTASAEHLDLQPGQNATPFDSSLSPDITAALAELPEEQRVLVLLVDIEQFDYQEVADLMNIPIGTVRSRLSRARWKLANRLHHLRDQS